MKKTKEQEKPEKWEEKGRRKQYVNNIHKERLMIEMRTKKFCE